MPIEMLMLVGALLIIAGILASKVSSRLGIPALLLFLAVGMLAGSEGPGGLHFDNPGLVQSVGVFALSYILFAGGLDTDWPSIRPVLKSGFALSTCGVAVTALIVGWFIHLYLDVPLLVGLLIGAIISSTDAAAVFSVLRSKNIHLRGNLKPLLELESGSNDPMAVFLTAGVIMLITEPQTGMISLIPLLVWQMTAGAGLGILFGKLAVTVINRLRLEYDGLYSVLSLSLVPLIYGLASLGKANAFLAVYVAGIVMGNSAFVQKKSLLRFHDGLAWLMQIVMFLVLGLQIFPSHLVPVIPAGLVTAFVLMVVARPFSVFVSLSRSGMSVFEKCFVSWVGLRGAVPIILATFPLLAGLPQAELIFNLVFFVVLTSALLQGSSIPLCARILKLEGPQPYSPASEDGLGTACFASGAFHTVTIPAESLVAGKQLVDLNLPSGVLVVYIQRGATSIIPQGSTVIEAGDTLHIAADHELGADTLALFQGRTSG